MRLGILPLLVGELRGRTLLLARPGALLVEEDPLLGGGVLGLRGEGLLLVVRLGLEAAALVLRRAEVVDGVGIGHLGLGVADDVEAGGVSGVAEPMEGIVLLVEEEGEDRGVLDVAELVVAVA
uniref:Uncharacterized protein n=1 Tax=Arundo donax TaxID=35708 RepID=A0A0A9DZK9_ARUDO